MKINAKDKQLILRALLDMEKRMESRSRAVPAEDMQHVRDLIIRWKKVKV